MTLLESRKRARAVASSAAVAHSTPRRPGSAAPLRSAPRSMALRHLRNTIMTVLMTAGVALALIPLISLVTMVVVEGSDRLDLAYFTHSMRGVVGAGGGALHAIVGTLLVTAVAAAISVPLGILTAVYLVEFGRGRWARSVRFLIDVMTGIPSIVAGLFAFSLFVLLSGDAGIRSGLAGAVALSVLMIPVVVRSSEEVLQRVPGDVREASLALGVPYWATVLKVVLPTARSGLMTGVLLAVARVAGETAPLLLVAGYTTSMNYNVADGRMMTLPVFVYTEYTQAAGANAADAIDRAWTGALVLMVFVLLLYVTGRVLVVGSGRLAAFVRRSRRSSQRRKRRAVASSAAHLSERGRTSVTTSKESNRV